MPTQEKEAERRQFTLEHRIGRAHANGGIDTETHVMSLDIRDVREISGLFEQVEKLKTKLANVREVINK